MRREAKAKGREEVFIGRAKAKAKTTIQLLTNLFWRLPGDLLVSVEGQSVFVFLFLFKSASVQRRRNHGP